MTVDRSMATILLAPLLGLAIPAAVLFWKKPAVRITPYERELISFSSQPLAVTQPGRQNVFSGLECPVRPPPPNVVAKQTQGQTKGFPPGPIPSPGAAPEAVRKSRPAPRLPSVSMIYGDPATRVAIIDGHVLHEGGSLGSDRIVKIEKTRVLLRTAGKDIWLNID